MFKAYVMMATGLVWLVGTFATRDEAQVGIDTFTAQLMPGRAIADFIVPTN